MECFSKKKKVGVVPQILSLSHFLHCVAMLVGHCCPKKKKKKKPSHPSQLSPPTKKLQKATNLCDFCYPRRLHHST